MKQAPYFMTGTMIRLASMAVGLLLTSCGATPARQLPSNMAVYEGIGSNLVDVFNFKAGMATHVGRQFFETHEWQSEFGGPIQFCSSDRFHCLTYGLPVAVPKQDITAAWSTNGLDCTRQGSQGEVFHIECRSDRRNAVEFSYMKRRGIISYRAVCPDCNDTTFRLVGEQGLFSQQSSNLPEA